MHYTIKPVRVFAGRGLAAVSLMWLAGAVAAPQAAAPQVQQTGSVQGQAQYADRSIGDWLTRMHEAARLRSYIGTLVVSSNNGGMSSARVWHACDDAGQQVERVESLTGAPQSTFRRNDEVVTFLPASRLVRTERRESLRLFPGVPNPNESSIPEFYTARRLGADRVAGFETEVLELAPKDNLRFGYRVWSEKKSGLVLKVQTIGHDGVVLEQAAFSELQLDAPVRPDKLSRMMAAPQGWRVEKTEAVKTSAASEGWTLRAPIAGFQPVNCYRRHPAGTAPADGTLQWIFSDGLAAVSLFVEAYDRQRHPQEGLFSSGATQTFTRRVDDWWVTAVGEVPPQTLKAFAHSLERRK